MVQLAPPIFDQDKENLPFSKFSANLDALIEEMNALIYRGLVLTSTSSNMKSQDANDIFLEMLNLMNKGK